MTYDQVEGWLALGNAFAHNLPEKANYTHRDVAKAISDVQRLPRWAPVVTAILIRLAVKPDQPRLPLPQFEFELEEATTVFEPVIAVLQSQVGTFLIVRGCPSGRVQVRL